MPKSDEWTTDRVCEDGTIEDCVIETYVRFPKGMQCFGRPGELPLYVEVYIDQDPFDLAVRFSPRDVKQMAEQMAKICKDAAELAEEQADGE